MSDKTKTIFETLASLDISKQVEDKKGLKYLSWSFAWSFVKTNYPNANYKVIQFEGRPFLFDENLGYLVATEVTVNDETISMQLPVMDGANRAQKHIAYKQWGKDVLPATMFDINTAIMRCLVKNLAMFGLGISLYSGEDLPEIKEIKNEEIKAKNSSQKPPAESSKPVKSKNEQIVEDLIKKLENNQIQDLEKSKIWLLENEQKVPVNLFKEATDLITQKENQPKVEINLTQIM